MILRTLVMAAVLVYPASAHAISCGISIEVVNHPPQPVIVLLKSFNAERTLPAPSPEDVNAPVYDGGVPAYLSSLEQIEIPAGDTATVKFRRLCSGPFLLNWKVVPTTNQTTASGQLLPRYGEIIDIRWGRSQ